MRDTSNGLRSVSPAQAGKPATHRSGTRSYPRPAESGCHTRTCPQVAICDVILRKRRRLFKLRNRQKRFDRKFGIPEEMLIRRRSGEQVILPAAHAGSQAREHCEHNGQVDEVHLAPNPESAQYPKTKNASEVDKRPRQRGDVSTISMEPYLASVPCTRPTTVGPEIWKCP